MITMVEKKKQTRKHPKKKTVVRNPSDPEIGYITRGGQGRTVKIYDYLSGTSIKEIDEKRRALRPGRRVSRHGNVYWEFRANRADRNPLEML